MVDKILYEEKTNIERGKYTFCVDSVETHWKGDVHGGGEGMSGNFLNQKVLLIDCKQPSVLEKLAVEMKVILHHNPNQETTNEPEGYAELKHEQLVKQLKGFPQFYLQHLRKAVKARL